MTNSYELTRLNAVTHGILSKETVLPHESREEFEDLLAQYTADFAPATATERTLVEELTTVVWRKKRLLKAENAKINIGLSGTLRSSNQLINNSSPISLHIKESCVDVRSFLGLSDEETANKKEALAQEEQKLLEAEKILAQGGRNCARRASERLGEMLQALWHSDEYFQENRESLSYFLSGKARRVLEQTHALLSHAEAVKQQALGNAVNQVSFDSFARYEAHLDRKYERILTMLIKLRSLRQVPAADTQSPNS